MNRNTMEIKKYVSQLEHDVIGAMNKPGPWYWAALAISILCFLSGLSLWGYQMFFGMGVAGITHPVGWGVYITNFVFWVGIAHSGTLISAVLFLFRAKYRNSFNRTAEAMTVFAVMTAGLFPLIHLGRTWYAYWLFPYPNQRLLWINFRSPLIWDVFAVNTYLTVSAIFFFVGMIPDLAIVRRLSTGLKKLVFSVLSLGWQGSLNQWRHYNKLYLYLAALATPLVISVHSIVSWDFAMSIVPGWHTTIFAPYFVAGAIFSGTAMVITLVVPMRRIFKFEKYITIDHFESIAKILLLTSLIVTYSYIVEIGMAFYTGNIFEVAITRYRAVGNYKFFYWLMILCNSFFPLTLFIKKLRRNLSYLVFVAILVNIGMWIERFVLIVTSLAHDFNPYSWGIYKPTFVEIGITLGSFGLFFTLFLIFVKTLPVLSITELKEHAE
ncbi:MAG: hydrogenase [Candidatus Schekmanbacteria bacterium RBG_13_48_7]|uniref:Hydrogenase n=1 Tax=Candidatus Schekmanbacteria bacterium RBG_13_48_7 TaxID=1817878 RepID=A0A1F7S751_9BACT|nr:MAG: hydrogenase [Candidatus Schekmanbacteria bacterium RBG_13_48_7]